MIGDKLVINDYHRKAALQVMQALEGKLKTAKAAVAITVAGESGCGKSEVAQCIAELAGETGIKCIILGQDDYFIFPPKTNHAKRQLDIGWVGMGEVKLDQLSEHIKFIKQGGGSPLTKPLVYFEDDKIDEERLETSGTRLVIAEGTYTSTLSEADFHVFINRTYIQTKKNRLQRNRDPDVEFLENVLKIEHAIISKHMQFADIIIPPPADERQ